MISTIENDLSKHRNNNNLDRNGCGILTDIVRRCAYILLYNCAILCFLWVQNIYVPVDKYVLIANNEI